MLFFTTDGPQPRPQGSFSFLRLDLDFEEIQNLNVKERRIPGNEVVGPHECATCVKARFKIFKISLDLSSLEKTYLNEEAPFKALGATTKKGATRRKENRNE